jgi:hypothetical protein
MRVQREQKTITLSLSFVESRLLLAVLRALIKAYQVKPSEIDPKVASVWYSARGCQAAKMSAEETAEWLNTLHEFKGANLRLLQRWARQLVRKTERGYRVRVERDDAPAFLAAINDYRLMAAATHGIGQAEMDLGFPDALTALSPLQRKAMVEIDLLAWIIEVTLGCLADPTRSGTAPPASLPPG